MPIPIAAALGIGALAGGLSDLFSKKKKRRRYTLNDLKTSGYTPYNESEEIGNINRITDANLSRRRGNENQKAAKYGFEPLVPNYARESDIYDAQMKGVADVKTRAKAENNRIAQLLFQLNTGVDEYNDNLGGEFSDVLSGALGGAALGGELYNTLNPPKPYKY